MSSYMTSKAVIFLRNIPSAIKSLSWKRDPSIVLFGAWFGEKFADNSRFLYQYLSNNREELGLSHVVWVTNNKSVLEKLRGKGYEAYLMESEESKAFHKKAKYHIICNSHKTQKKIDSNGEIQMISGDILDDLSYGAVRINLWHGIGGPKAVGLKSNSYKEKRAKHPVISSIYEFMIHHSKNYQRFFRDRNGWAFCYRLAPSDTEMKAICDDHGCSESMCIHTNYPRNCECLQLFEEEQLLIEKMRNYDSVILYLPTFRSEAAYKQENIAAELRDFLSDNKVLWIEKPHSAAVSYSCVTSEINVVRLNADFDINVLMPYITILITDYSSVRMDAVYHRKPVFYYVPDFQEYKEGSNGFLDDPEKLMCGPILYTTNELRDSLVKFIKNPEKAKTEDYEKIRAMYWHENDDLAGIWQKILSATS